jgi:hypothetical protein
MRVKNLEWSVGSWEFFDLIPMTWDFLLVEKVEKVELFFVESFKKR